MNIEQSISAKLKRLESLSNEQLVKECNQKPDFKNDDEMYEIGKRIDAGTLKVVMKVNTLHILYGEYNAEDYLKEMFNPTYKFLKLHTEILKPHSEIFLNNCVLQTQPNHAASVIEYFIKKD